MDNYFIKINGKINIPEIVKIGHNYDITLQGSVTDERKLDNEDGTFSYVSTFRPITGTIGLPTGKTIKLRDTRSRSSQLRARVHNIWRSTDDPRMEDEAYDRFMVYIMQNADELFEKSK